MKQFKNEGLSTYAETDKDRAALKSLEDTGGDYVKTSEQLGITVSSCRNRLARLRRRAALRGWSPDHDVTKTTPEGYHLKGTSTLYTPDEKTGELKVRAQWVKTCKDREDLIEDMRIACAEMAEPLKGVIPAVKMKRVKKAEAHDPDLMAAYLIGDHHSGMYSWSEETGEDYDCDIAERILAAAFERLGAAAPNAHKALIVSIGDFFHCDSHSSRTPQSGHSLDSDGRHSRVIQTGIRMMRRAIDFALRKHVEVEVLILAGNHDPEASIWLAHCLKAAYDNEPRVNVRASPRVYQFTTWGKCLIGTCHGDKVKTSALAEIMATDARAEWGVAKFAHWYSGHIHHRTVQELRGCTVESLSVLAPGDAWHIGSGYRSQRGMQLDVWSQKHGRIQTIHGTVEYINNED